MNEENLIGLFYTDAERCDGLLAAASDGMNLGEGGKYDYITVVGFDAGVNQKVAENVGYIYGVFAQDPVSIGQLTMLLCISCNQGVKVSDIWISIIFYQSNDIDDSENMQIFFMIKF